jgi:hypothetical protein
LGGGNQRLFYIPSTECHNQGLHFVDKVTDTLTQGNISKEEQSKMVDDIFEEFCLYQDRDIITKAADNTDLVTLIYVELSSNNQQNAEHVSQETERTTENFVTLSFSDNFSDTSEKSIGTTNTFETKELFTDKQSTTTTTSIALQIKKEKHEIKTENQKNSNIDNDLMSTKDEYTHKYISIQF